MIILKREKQLPVIRLARVQTTASGKTWIFDFVDPVHKFAQSLIVFNILPVEQIEQLYEKLYSQWSDRIKHEEWLSGNAPVMPLVH